MKIITFFFLCLSGLAGMAQEITFSDTKYDFGVIQESGGAAYYDFYFMNTGKEPLQIQSVLVSCGCTTSEWSKQPVLPGEKGCIRVAYNLADRNEKKFTHIAEVYTNSKNFGTHKGVHDLVITGEVVREKRLPVHQYTLSAGVKPQERAVRQTADEYEQVLERMRAEILKNMDVRRNDLQTVEQVAYLQRGGSWRDIDYACYFRTNWEPNVHLRRVLGLVFSYVHPESDYFGNDSLYVAIRDALAFWQHRSPKCHNWWHNQIAVPQCLGKILVLLDVGRRELPEDIRQGLFKMMAWPDPRKWTGANKLDIAMHHIQRGCLLKNDSIVRTASEQAFYPIRITRTEGLQIDLSYQQHDNQLYIGAYGTVFTEGEVRVASWLQGTVYALQGERLKLLRDFILATYLNVFRGPYVDFSVVGRGISRKEQLNGHGTVEVLERMKQLDTAYATEYEQARIRFAEPGKSGYQRKAVNRVYWRSDYALHNREKYDFSVRTASVRTRKTESGNGENLSGGYLSDGATDIRVNGNEYNHIFPVWDWNKIPGVTVPQVPCSSAVAWGEMGKAVFSGGVSDGRYGVMAFYMQDYGIEARKSWFFFDDEVVCLGAGIRTGNTEEVVTCVNQCLLDGKVNFDERKTLIQTLPEGMKLKPQVKSLLHDSVLYVFPQPMDIRLFCGEQPGNWNTINYNEEDQKVAENVFKLWIEHEKGQEDARYAYIIAPGITDIRDYDSRVVEIKRNEPEMQVVYHQGLDILQAVFYQPGTYAKDGLSLTVDIPCVVMIKHTKTVQPVIEVADPTQREKACTVVFCRGKVSCFREVAGDELKGVKYKE